MATFRGVHEPLLVGAICLLGWSIDSSAALAMVWAAYAIRWWWAARAGPADRSVWSAERPPPDSRRTTHILGPASGSRIVDGRYRLVGLRGRGGFAVSYLAIHRETGRRVVLKMPRLENLEESMPCLVHEGDLLERLAECPLVVRILDRGVERQPYLVLEYVPETLESLARPAEGVVWWGRRLREAAAALSFCHRRGVLHADIKPANLGIGLDGRIRLLDFGSAVEVEGISPQPLAGTPAFAAPEVLRGETGPSVPSEVYSLGVTFRDAYLRHVGREGEAGEPALLDLLSRLAHPRPEGRPQGMEEILERVAGMLRTLDGGGEAEVPLRN
ncbi:MAG: serine/threonine protein kinase [Planctomycetes bacterium]|nr:serine/threonine protein kinase [Planctomycetota bacterium]